MFLEIPKSLAIFALGTFSLKCNLRINAQSSKVITPQSWASAHFSTVTSAQFSSITDKHTPRVNKTRGSPQATILAGGCSRPARASPRTRTPWAINGAELAMGLMSLE